MNPEFYSLSEAAGDIRRNRLSPVEYVETLLKRIDRLEPRIRAWVTVDRENAITEAQRCEAEAKQKKFRGPLHGVAIGVKDLFMTRNLRTTAGSRVFANLVPDHDAYAVTRLRQAGAIVLGKTVTTEFATFDPGPTRNPWNTRHTPGGSSSGSAASVAARMVPGAIGTQTVASIGRPAAFCGVVGFMPTARRISRSGAFPASWSLDHVGGFGRSVRDVELLVDSLVDVPIEKVRKTDQVRIGIVREFFDAKLTPEARFVHEQFLTSLKKTSAEIRDLTLPAIFDMSSAVQMTIMRTELGAAHEGLHHENAESYGKKLRALVETGQLVDAMAYTRALRIRKRFQREMSRLFDSVDVVISPGATGPAPEGLDYTGDPALSGPWTLADFPTITLPVALSPGGLPLGIQVSAPAMKEGLLLAIAHWLEEVIHFTNQPMLGD